MSWVLRLPSKPLRCVAYTAVVVFCVLSAFPWSVYQACRAAGKRLAEVYEDFPGQIREVAAIVASDYRKCLED